MAGAFHYHLVTISPAVSDYARSRRIRLPDHRLSALSGTLSCAGGCGYSSPLLPLVPANCPSSFSSALSFGCVSLSTIWLLLATPLAPLPASPPPCFVRVCAPSCLSSLLVCPCPGCPRPVCTSPEVAPPRVEDAVVLVDSLP